MSVYEFDPDMPDDASFEAGSLSHLVAGNRGRLLDARRTPVTIGEIDQSRARFAVVVDAFEDEGARWQLPLDQVTRIQFERGSARLDAGDAASLQGLVVEAMRTVEVHATREARAATERDLERERARVRDAVASRGALRDLDLAAHVSAREGSEEAMSLLAALATESEVASLEDEFARTFVSNPESGEVVKGHAIVLAEMGLCPYAGRIVIDEGLFDGHGAKELRRAHILLRLALLRELMSLLGRSEVELFRGLSADVALRSRPASSLVAATFARDVAMSHFEGGPSTKTSLLARQFVPVSRLFMTFIETSAMNERYREAEAVLVGEPDNLVF